jgi:hypothetical protein
LYQTKSLSSRFVRKHLSRHEAVEGGIAVARHFWICVSSFALWQLAATHAFAQYDQNQNRDYDPSRDNVFRVEGTGPMDIDPNTGQIRGFRETKDSASQIRDIYGNRYRFIDPTPRDPSLRDPSDIEREKRLREQKAARDERFLRDKSDDLRQFKDQMDDKARRLQQDNSEYDRRLQKYELLNQSDSKSDLMQRLGIANDDGSYSKYFDSNGNKIMSALQEERNGLVGLQSQVDDQTVSLRRSVSQYQQQRDQYNQYRQQAVGNLQQLDRAQTDWTNAANNQQWQNYQQRLQQYQQQYADYQARKAELERQQREAAARAAAQAAADAAAAENNSSYSYHSSSGPVGYH